MPTEAETRRRTATAERERPTLDSDIKDPMGMVRTRQPDRDEEFATLRDPFDTRRKLSEDEIAILKAKYAAGASDAEFAVFIRVCERTGLDPFTEQIRFLKRKKRDENGQWVDTFSIQIGIDGARLIATRTGQYRGQTPVEWCDKDGNWRDVWLWNTPPKAARVGVHRSGFIEPLYAIAHFGEYVQKNRQGQAIRMWAAMPAGQLAKCAEALALRKAFPQELAGLYTTDEMAQALNDDPPDEPRRRPARAPSQSASTSAPASGSGAEDVGSESADDGDIDDIGYRATFLLPFGPHKDEPITSKDVSIGTLLHSIEWVKRPEAAERDDYALWLEAASAEVVYRIRKLSKADIDSAAFAKVATWITKTPERKTAFQWVIDEIAEQMTILEKPESEQRAGADTKTP
jgi:phage recombination protein Bet